MSATHLSPIGQIAQRHDPVRFLCALLAPLEAREAIFALLAFNGELARIRTLVSEPALGLIRLQWWREALEAGDRRSHEVLTPLMDAVQRHTLSPSLLLAMVDRYQDELEGEGKASDAALYRLMLECIDERSEAGVIAAEVVGLGYAQKDKKILVSAPVANLSRRARLVLLSRHLALHQQSPWRGFLLLWRGLLP